MPDPKYQALYDEVDKLLSELNLGDAAQRLQDNPSDQGTMLLAKGML